MFKRPRSLSRTIESAVRNVVTICKIMAISPGTIKLALRESGLKSIFGRTSIGSAVDLEL
ncbi:MAG: hypothetical protein ACM3SR_07015 [Ignavibacteriales bacterium]